MIGTVVTRACLIAGAMASAFAARERAASVQVELIS